MRIAKCININGEYDNIPAYEINDFPWDKCRKIHMLCKHKKNLAYMVDFVTFDIECTTIEDYTLYPQPFGFMYHWQACIFGTCIYGRTIEDLRVFFKKLVDVYGLNEHKRLCIYVHNLAYEFQFIKDILYNDFGEFDIFATDERKPLKVSTKSGLEFRCSYRLTNMTLYQASINEKGVEHIKAKDDLDYNIPRFVETELNDIEFGYCISDVLSLFEIILNRLKNDRDTLESIPMTSTGYVRRDCRNECRKDKKYFNFFQQLKINAPLYEELLLASRGGNTHANHNMSGRIWESTNDIGLWSADAVSEYPFQMFKKFPITQFQYYGHCDTLQEFENLVAARPCLFHLILQNPRLKKTQPIPYIPEDKCIRLSRARFDNGRILSADLLEIVITDIDYKIIKKQYDFDSMLISNMYVSTYGDLPKPITDTVLKYFADKCELKQKIKEAKTEEEKKEYQYLYGKQKNKLNGIFGMMFTRPIHNENKYDFSCGLWYEETVDVQAELDKYFKSRNNFSTFAWGVWITAYGREWLQLLIDTVQNNEGTTIYCDTDSDKFLGTDTTLKAIEDINTNIKNWCDNRGAFYDLSGKRFYMGIFEIENDIPLKSFITLGAKKYCYEDIDGLHLTVSGVSKGDGAKELKDIKNFKPGFVFKKAGGIALWYNDFEKPKAKWFNYKGHTIRTFSNIGMLESEYTLGITEEYAELIGLNLYSDLEWQQTNINFDDL